LIGANFTPAFGSMIGGISPASGESSSGAAGRALLVIAVVAAHLVRAGLLPSKAVVQCFANGSQTSTWRSAGWLVEPADRGTDRGHYIEDDAARQPRPTYGDGPVPARQDVADRRWRNVRRRLRPGQTSMEQQATHLSTPSPEA
jgi:hypothetical protein